MSKLQPLYIILRNRIQQYCEMIEQLTLDKSKKIQLHADFIDYVRVCEGLAKKHLLLNDLTNISVIILTALVPIIIHITPIDRDKYDGTYLQLATILSVILAILNGLRQSYKYREKWQNYRHTAEQLILEGQTFFALSGKYASYHSHELAFRKFIDAVNALRTQQLNAYISQVMAVNDQEITQSVNAEVKTRIAEISAVKAKVITHKQIDDELNAYVRSQPNISYYQSDHEQKLVTIFANDPTFTGPDKFRFTNPALEGLVYKVITQVGDAEIHMSLAPSDGIKNRDMPLQGFGSVGCLCKRTDGNLVLVTCYHVVRHPSQNWGMFLPGQNDAVINSSSEYIGDIIEGERTTELDTALVGVDQGVKIDEILPNGVKIIDPIYIDEENFQNFTEVFIISRHRNFKKVQGKLSSVNKPITINYGDRINRDDRTLERLMIVNYVSTEPFSMPGDSGSLVFTNDGTAIGIVVGGDSQRASFVIPFTTIRDRFNLKLL